MKVFVLGSTGMLGLAVHRELLGANVETLGVARQGADISFDCFSDSIENVLAEVSKGDFLVNCIGLITQKFSPMNPTDRWSAIKVNALFPHELAHFAESVGARVVQIATDCVFSGTTGQYVESSSHDASDVYGKSKSLGEVPSPSFMHLRTSIIGHETNSSASLLEWVLHHPHGSTLTGYDDRWWNGITTNAFGRIVAGIVKSGSFQPGLFHVLPVDALNKAQLVALIAKTFGRTDLSVIDQPSGEPKDLTLATQYPDVNESLWQLAEYHSRPTIELLISELASSSR